MTNPHVEKHISEAEMMLAKLRDLSIDNENYSFIIEEIGSELDKADASLRSKMLEITYDQKDAYTIRIQSCRQAVKPFKETAKRFTSPKKGKRFL